MQTSVAAALRTWTASVEEKTFFLHKEPKSVGEQHLTMCLSHSLFLAVFTAWLTVSEGAPPHTGHSFWVDESCQVRTRSLRSNVAGQSHDQFLVFWSSRECQSWLQGCHVWCWWSCVVDLFLGLMKRTVWAVYPSKTTRGNECVKLARTASSLFLFAMLIYVRRRALCHSIGQQKGHRSSQIRQIKIPLDPLLSSSPSPKKPIALLTNNTYRSP